MGDKFRKALIRLIRESVPNALITGKVIAVDTMTFTCDVQPDDDGPVIYNVRLKTAIDSDDSGIVIIPANNSNVTIGTIGGDRNNLYLNKYGKINSYKIKLEGGATLECDGTGNIKLNGGLLGGIVKITELKTELAKLNANIALLKTATSAAISVYSGALDSGVSATAFNTTVGGMATQNLTTLENTKVKQ